MVRHVATLLTLFVSLCGTVAAAAHDITLSGREATALRLAVDDFIHHHYSASGDLTRYTLKLRRTPKQLDVDFIPDADPRGVYPGGGTVYGPDVSYSVILKSMKLVAHPFGQ
jgi:hypothetical protein